MKKNRARPTPQQKKARRIFWTLLLIVVVSVTGYLTRKKPAPPPKFVDTGCERIYKKFYDKDTIDMRIVFGYKDSRPARFVGDRYERAYFIQRVLKLGFTRVAGNDELFGLKLTGPDRREKNILLQITDSSVGPDDVENRKDPFQKWRSAETEKRFLEGLRVADVVLYNGHSRGGGGPDFESPRTLSNLHVDYEWYRREKPGFRQMIAVLKSSNQAPKLIGLFSCISDRLFSKEIQKVNGGRGLITTETLLYYADSLENLYLTLQALIEMKCHPNFHLDGTRTVGFFDPERD